MSENKKKCRTCGVKRGLGEYYCNKKTGNYHNDCKKCCCKAAKKHLKENKKEISARKKNIRYNKKVAEILGIEYNARKRIIKEKKCNVCEKIKQISNFNKGCGKCKDCQSEYARKWREDNREHNLERKRKHYKENREEIRKKQNIKNKSEEAKLKRKIYRKKRLKNPINRLNKSISDSIRCALKGKKSYRKWQEILGYTLEDLRNHIESKFEPWMTWENYGNPNGDHTNCWHIDHVIPKCYFKYDSEHDEEFKLCWSLNNLQPKEAKLNMSKGSRYIG